MWLIYFRSIPYLVFTVIRLICQSVQETFLTWKPYSVVYRYSVILYSCSRNLLYLNLIELNPQWNVNQPSALWTGVQSYEIKKVYFTIVINLSLCNNSTWWFLCPRTTSKYTSNLPTPESISHDEVMIHVLPLSVQIISGVSHDVSHFTFYSRDPTCSYM